MDALSHAVLTFLANAAWQVPLVAAVAWAWTRVAGWRAPARHRHAVWVAALSVAVLLPAASAWPGALAAPDPAGSATAAAPAAGNVAAWLRGGAGGGARLPVSDPLAWAVAGAYGVFLAVRLAGLARKWRRTRAIRATAEARPLPGPVVEAARACRRAFGVAAAPVLCSSSATGPVTVGARRPIVLLPESLLAEPDPDVLVTAIGHEMAHVRRRDFAVNLLCELLALPVSFHPATAFLRRRIAETRELACDEQVTERLLDGPSYARALVHLARAASAGARTGYSLGVFDADVLEERIMRLIDERPRANARAGRVLVLVAALALAVSGAAASANSVSVFGFSPAQSAERTMIGHWSLYIRTDGDEKEAKKDEAGGLPAMLAIDFDGRKLSGTATVWPAIRQPDGTVVEDESKKVVFDLIEPRFDGRTFNFSVFNGQENLVGELQLGDDGTFTGRWISMKSKQAGTLRMVRK